MGRVLVVLDDERENDVFEVLGIADGVARVRSAYLFELGEELAVRVEQDGAPIEMIARVRAHGGPPGDRITELELSDPRSDGA